MTDDEKGEAAFRGCGCGCFTALFVGVIAACSSFGGGLMFLDASQALGLALVVAPSTMFISAAVASLCWWKFVE